MSNTHPEANPAATLAAHVDHLRTTWDAALEHSDYDGVVLAAGQAELFFQDDHGPVFKPNPYFTQWVAPEFAQPDALIMLRQGRTPVLLTPDPEDYWHASPPLPEHLQEHLDVRTFADSQGLLNAAMQELDEPSKQRMAFIGRSQGNEQFGPANPANLVNFMDFQRAVKTPFELELMRRASDIGVRGHIAAAAAFASGGSEFEIHLAYLAASAQNEHQLPYGNIVACNENAATLHYQFQQRERLATPRSLLIDAGGSYQGYASDITRTYAAEGSEHEEFSSLLSAMQAHQDAILDRVGPDMTFAELHAFMHENLAHVAVAEGLVECSAEAALEHGVTRALCPHGLGHLLGIQVHDVGGHMADADGTPAPPPPEYPALRFTRTIAANQVFTIEPGLYFIDSLLHNLREADAPMNWAKLERLQPYGGIRIEDNVRVLPSGCENLTRDAWVRCA